ncbi:MAG TPA: FAD-binding oxidoreductase [Solirubrobacteraceae bacterium]|nr:FAD-binding oxidoreductase [Solirubrobacteraceae bacterium]
MDARTELSWSGWGDPAQATELPASIHELLRTGLGVTRATPTPAAISDLVLAAPRLDAEAAGQMAAVVGDAHVAADHSARARHALGRSTLDLLALRAGRPLPAPDLIVSPGSHEEVAGVLALCAARRIAVVPFGGGTSVVGGLTPDAEAFAGWLALDLRRLDALHELDEVSRVATLGAGLRGPEAEAILGARGYTIGHFPQSFEYASLGGFAAARSSGQASAGYGRFDELVHGLRVAAPAGELRLGRAPKSAAGPDLRQLMLGSEGAFGVITELTIRVRPRPAQRAYDGWRFPDFATGCAALRRLVQDGPVPTVLRLSDEAETAMGLARPDAIGSAEASGCLAIAGYEGDAGAVTARRAAADAVLADAGAVRVADAGAEWEHGRYRGPYLRDALLDAGALVETLETVTFWSGVPGLYAAVTAALRDTLTAAGTPPVVLCHVSHVYPAGASLYFTVACAQAADPIAQWREAKRVTGAAILAHGGSISHHHGVGRDHRSELERELGGLGVAVLRAVKATLDPTGILNPGILITP